MDNKTGTKLTCDGRNENFISLTPSAGIVKEGDTKDQNHKLPNNPEIVTSQIDLSNVEDDSSKYIEALITRQKRSDECIDISDIRSRTPKFDAKKESSLALIQLDERGRPKSEPLSEITTILLFDTTINCTENLGISDFLDFTNLCVFCF